MKTVVTAALAALALGTPALAQDVPNPADRTTAQTPTVVVSCYRGPWDEVIWDHPQAPFTDSLVAIGYSFERANAIAQRICRDPSLVGRPEALRAATAQILRTAPRN